MTDAPEFEVRADGVVAFHNGFSRSDNPHPEGTPAARTWEQGWRDARDASEEFEDD